MLFKTMSQLGDTLKGIVRVSNGTVQILDAQRIHGPLIDRLAWTAAFHEKVEMRGMASWIIKMLAPSFGIHFKTAPAPSVFAIPSLNIRGMAYDLGRTFFRIAASHPFKAFAPVADSKNKQAGYAAILAASAIQEGFQGLFLFQEKNPDGKNHILIDTLLEALQDKSGPRFEAASSDGEHPFHLTIRVFIEQADPKADAEASLWQLPQALRRHISIEIGKKLDEYFKKQDCSQALPNTHHIGHSADLSFTLRDEISAAMSDSDKNKAFFESLPGHGLKTET